MSSERPCTAAHPKPAGRDKIGSPPPVTSPSQSLTASSAVARSDEARVGPPVDGHDHARVRAGDWPDARVPELLRRKAAPATHIDDKTHVQLQSFYWALTEWRRSRAPRFARGGRCRRPAVNSRRWDHETRGVGHASAPAPRGQTGSGARRIARIDSSLGGSEVGSSSGSCELSRATRQGATSPVGGGRACADECGRVMGRGHDRAAAEFRKRNRSARVRFSAGERGAGILVGTARSRSVGACSLLRRAATTCTDRVRRVQGSCLKRPAAVVVIGKDEPPRCDHRPARH